MNEWVNLCVNLALLVLIGLAAIGVGYALHCVFSRVMRIAAWKPRKPTDSGRLSSTEPNPSNVPHTESSAILRELVQRPVAMQLSPRGLGLTSDDLFAEHERALNHLLTREPPKYPLWWRLLPQRWRKPWRLIDADKNHPLELTRSMLAMKQWQPEPEKPALLEPADPHYRVAEIDCVIDAFSNRPPEAYERFVDQMRARGVEPFPTGPRVVRHDDVEAALRHAADVCDLVARSAVTPGVAQGAAQCASSIRVEFGL
jgi:hypothetical protein